MRTRRHCHCNWPLHGNNMAMYNSYAEEYQDNIVSQITGKISLMRKQLKPGVLSAVSSPHHERWI